MMIETLYFFKFVGGDESSSASKARRQFGRRFYGNRFGLPGKQTFDKTLQKGKEKGRANTQKE